MLLESLGIQAEVNATGHVDSVGLAIPQYVQNYDAGAKKSYGVGKSLEKRTVRRNGVRKVI